MGFVAIGVVLLLLKLAAYGPVAEWGWLAVLSPFAAAVVWWGISDHFGITKRHEMDKMDKRKAARRAKSLEALGMGDPKKKR